MSRRTEAALAAALFVAAIVLAGSAPTLAAAAFPSGGASVLPGATMGPTTIFLYGDATHGWGNATSTISNPGPTLYLYQGENVSMALYAADGIPHNWFIDYNRNGTWDSATELASPDFSTKAVATWFNFTVPTDRIGAYTYLCRYHPTLMTGTVYILSPRNLTLYGSASASPGEGWGFNTSSVRNPGPTLWILAGDNVTLHLVSADGQPHTWFIAYDNGTAAAGGEPASPRFEVSPIDFPFTADRTGTFTYRCGVHPTIMFGSIVIVGLARPSAAPKIDLVPTIMIGTIVGVLVLAAIYQVRAVSKARRTK